MYKFYIRDIEQEDINATTMEEVIAYLTPIMQEHCTLAEDWEHSQGSGTTAYGDYTYDYCISIWENMNDISIMAQIDNKRKRVDITADTDYQMYTIYNHCLGEEYETFGLDEEDAITRACNMKGSRSEWCEVDCEIIDRNTMDECEIKFEL